MKIWVISKYSGEDCFDNGTTYEYYASYELAKKHLDEHRRSFKDIVYDGKPIFKFTTDESDEFSCNDGKWTHDYGISAEELIES